MSNVEITAFNDYPLEENKTVSISTSDNAQIYVNGEKRGQHAVMRDGDVITLVSNMGERFYVSTTAREISAKGTGITLEEPIRKPKQKPYVDYRKPYFQRQNGR